MSTHTTLAIDPGASGAIAIIDPQGKLATYPLGEYSDMLALLRDTQAQCLADGYSLTAWLEEIPLFAGPNGSAMIKLGLSAGWYRGACEALGIPLRLVRPQVWQAGLSGVGKLKGAERKRALREEARRRWPAHKITLETCDAALLADYGRRQLA